jgi:hypothetical protein
MYIAYTRLRCGTVDNKNQMHIAVCLALTSRVKSRHCVQYSRPYAATHNVLHVLVSLPNSELNLIETVQRDGRERK